MLDHIKKKLPEMRRSLEAELRLCEKHLKTLGRQPLFPNAIAARDSRCIQDFLAETYASFQPQYRRFTELMTDELFQIDVKPLGIVDDEEANKLLTQHWNPSYLSHIKRNHQEHHILALEVKKIGEDSRNMINVPYVGKRTELETWLKTFIELLEKVVKKFIEDVFGAL